MVGDLCGVFANNALVDSYTDCKMVYEKVRARKEKTSPRLAKVIKKSKSTGRKKYWGRISMRSLHLQKYGSKSQNTPSTFLIQY